MAKHSLGLSPRGQAAWDVAGGMFGFLIFLALAVADLFQAAQDAQSLTCRANSPAGTPRVIAAWNLSKG